MSLGLVYLVGLFLRLYRLFDVVAVFGHLLYIRVPIHWFKWINQITCSSKYCQI
jgi:hypothetical protein